MNTYGYDYAFALSIDTVNQILTRKLTGVDMSISYTTTDSDSGTTVTLGAQLAPWQIVPGGSNTLLNINLPIASGTLTLKGAINCTYNLAKVIPELQITLGWMGTSDEQDATGTGDATYLTFNPNDATDANDPGYVATITVHDPQNHLDSTGSGVLSQIMTGALYSNRETIKYIFANVNPTPPNVASWLNPGQWVYYYAGTPIQNALCFLCMLSSTAPMPSTPAFDATALASGANSALVISQPQFFQNVVMPGVQSAFPNAEFTLSTNSQEVCTITNSWSFDVGSLPANTFSLTPSNDGNGLQLYAAGSGPLKFFFGLADLPNASYSWSLSAVNPLRFDGRNITFANDPNPTITHDHTIYWYDWMILVILGITNLVGLISVITEAVIGFYDSSVQMGTAAINSNLQAATGGTVANLATLIDWQIDGETLTPSDAGMSGALYVHGTLA
jgi:hypothetical protein